MLLKGSDHYLFSNWRQRERFQCCSLIYIFNNSENQLCYYLLLHQPAGQTFSTSVILFLQKINIQDAPIVQNQLYNYITRDPTLTDAYMSRQTQEMLIWA